MIDFSIPMGKPMVKRTAKSGKDRVIVDATKAKVEIGLERIRRSGLVRPFIAELRGGGSTVRGIDKPLATFSAQGYHHALVTAARHRRNRLAAPTAALLQQRRTTPGHRANRAPLPRGLGMH